MTARIVLHATRRVIAPATLDALAITGVAMPAALLANTPAQLWDRVSERAA
jgi:hypothetical protein